MGKLIHHTENNGCCTLHNAAEGNIESLKAYFSPNQEGSGNPSPSNVRNIGGRMGLNIIKCGKNFLDISKYAGTGITIDNNVLSGTARNLYENSVSANKMFYFYPWMHHSTISLSAYTSGNVSRDGDGLQPVVQNLTATPLWQKVIYTYPNSTSTYVEKSLSIYQANNSISPERFIISNWSKEGNVWYIKNLQVELGDIMTDYEPYHGITYPINFFLVNNVFNNPTFNTTATNGGWYHWGDTGHDGTCGQNTAKNYIYDKSQSYSHWVANGSNATKNYLIYQNPAFDGGYRSMQFIIKHQDSLPITNDICHPAWNAGIEGAPHEWTSIISLGDGFYLCKCEGFYQDGSNDLIGINVHPGNKIYISYGCCENNKQTSTNLFAYGGYVDLVNGQLVVDYEFKIYDGSEDEPWIAQDLNGGRNFYIAAPSNWKKNNGTELYCNMGKTTGGFEIGEAKISRLGNLNINIGTLINVSSAADFKIWLQTHNLQVAAKLEEPITYQLTSQQLKTFKGITNIYSDVNNKMEIEYELVETKAMHEAKKHIMYNQPKLKYWLNGDDAPINGKWVDRVSKQTWTLYNGASHDSTNGLYLFNTMIKCAALDGNWQNFTLGHHWIFDYDIYLNFSESDTGCFFDIGSVAQASKAIGFYAGSKSGNVSKTFFLNWKLAGNSSNPFSSNTIHPARALINDNEYAHIKGTYSLIDGKNGYDKLLATINGITILCEDQIPKATYNNWSSGNKNSYIVIGRTAYNSPSSTATDYSCCCKVKDIKFYIID